MQYNIVRHQFCPRIVKLQITYNLQLLFREHDGKNIQPNRH